MRSYLAEFIGTFVLVLIGTLPIALNSAYQLGIPHLVIAFSFGVPVTAMIYTFGKVSGAHINPAVTFGFWLSGRFSSKKVFPYVIAQFSGALFASTLLLLFIPKTNSYGATAPSGTILETFLLEILLTFLLMYVIIRVSTTPTWLNKVAAIAIGGVVFLEALFAGPITGASMNPARSFGPAIISGDITHLWIYFVAPIIGASIAIALCKVLYTKNCCDKPNAFSQPTP